MRIGRSAARLALVLATLGAAAAAPAAAEGWIYPRPEVRDRAGRQVFPTSDGREFMSALEREEYLRQSRDLLRAPNAAAAAAARARAAAEAAAEPAPPRGAPTILLPPTGDARWDRLRELDAAQAAAGRERQRRLQWLLDSRGPADAAGMRAAIAGARADRAARVAEGMDRLQSGAAAARSTLGRSERRPRRPLIVTPRIEVFD